MVLSMLFPLIQLPRKSEAKNLQETNASLLVSINSTSEEVRRDDVEAFLSEIERVSINSTSEEVRSLTIRRNLSTWRVSINSTSEEVRRVGF